VSVTRDGLWAWCDLFGGETREPVHIGQRARFVGDSTWRLDKLERSKGEAHVELSLVNRGRKAAPRVQHQLVRGEIFVWSPESTDIRAPVHSALGGLIVLATQAFAKQLEPGHVESEVFDVWVPDGKPLVVRVRALSSERTLVIGP
jgi:hypothetical protein